MDFFDIVDSTNEFSKLNNDQIYEMYQKIIKKTPSELNSLSYKEAIKRDKRKNIQYLKRRFLLIISIITFLLFRTKKISELDLEFLTKKLYYLIRLLFEMKNHKVFLIKI